MKIINFILIFSIPLISNGQSSFGWNVFKDDSLKISEFSGNKLIRSIGEYKNGQLKYIRYRKYKSAQILDTVEYYSSAGTILAKVTYDTLKRQLFDSIHLANYQFVDSCINIAKRQVGLCFSDKDIHDYIVMSPSHSMQQSAVFDKYRVATSKLYEPQNYPIKVCRIIYLLRTSQENSKGYNSFYFRIDSTFKIVQSNIFLNRRYQINYTFNYADSLRNKYNYKNQFNSKKERGIKITGPYLEFRKRKLYWIVRREIGEILFNDNLDHINFQNTYEELVIDSENGEHKQILKRKLSH